MEKDVLKIVTTIGKTLDKLAETHGADKVHEIALSMGIRVLTHYYTPAELRELVEHIISELEE